MLRDKAVAIQSICEHLLVNNFLTVIALKRHLNHGLTNSHGVKGRPYLSFSTHFISLRTVRTILSVR